MGIGNGASKWAEATWSSHVITAWFLEPVPVYLLSICSTAKNASCGISTRPICFIRFCLLSVSQAVFLTTDIATVAFSQHIFRIALTVEREMICDPIAAWIATSNICRGIKSFIFRTIHAHGVRLDDDAR